MLDSLGIKWNPGKNGKSRRDEDTKNKRGMEGGGVCFEPPWDYDYTHGISACTVRLTGITFICVLALAKTELKLQIHRAFKRGYCPSAQSAVTYHT